MATTYLFVRGIVLGLVLRSDRPGSLPDNVVVHDAEVAAPKRVAADDEDQLKPGGADAKSCDASDNRRVGHRQVEHHLEF